MKTKDDPYIFLCATGRSIDDVGVARGTIFQEIRPGAGLETGDFVQEKFGGSYIVGRLYLARARASLLRGK